MNKDKNSDLEDEKPTSIFEEKPKVYDDNVLPKGVFDDLLHAPTSLQKNEHGELFENLKTDFSSEKKFPSTNSMNVSDEEKKGLLGDSFFSDVSTEQTPTRRNLFNQPNGYTGDDDLGKPAIWTRNKDFGRSINLTDD
jgi:hypothetical protein